MRDTQRLWQTLQLPQLCAWRSMRADPRSIRAPTTSEPTMPRLSRLAAAALTLAAGAVFADPLLVVSSGGMLAANDRLAAEFARSTGEEVRTAFGPSMGQTKDAIPARLGRHEPVDAVVMVGGALDKLMASGQLEPGSKVVVADSTIACAVRHGAPHPDIHTVEGLKNALLAAKSVAWSDSASGEYISKQMLAKLGIAEQVQPKGHTIPATPVAEIVARGEADFGCQQRSEMLPVQGIDIVGDLPPEVQYHTPYAAAVVAGSPRAALAKRYIDFLVSPHGRDVIRETGLEPGAPAAK